SLSAANQHEQPDRDQRDRPEEVSAERTQQPEVRDQQVPAQRDQDDPDPDSAGTAAPTGPRRRPPARGRAAGLGGRSLGSALRRSAEAGPEILPDFLAHGTQPLADVPRSRRGRASGRLHQEPQREVQQDADSRPDQGEDDEHDPDQQRLDAEILPETGADTRDDAIGTTP